MLEKLVSSIDTCLALKVWISIKDKLENITPSPLFQIETVYNNDATRKIAP